MKKIIPAVLISITLPFAKTMTLNGEFKARGELFTGKFSNKENQCVLDLMFGTMISGGGSLHIQCEKEYKGVISLECSEDIASLRKSQDNSGYFGYSISKSWSNCKEFKVIFRD